MKPNVQTQNHRGSDEHHRDESPLNALEVLRSESTAKGMPVEWVFDRANLSRGNVAISLST